jgi:hypothetical protein
VLINIEPEVYDSYVIEENNENVVQAQILKALNGMLQASLLLRKDLENISLK